MSLLRRQEPSLDLAPTDPGPDGPGSDGPRSAEILRRLEAIEHRLAGLEAAGRPSPVYVGDRTTVAPTHFDRWIYLDTDDRSVCPRILTTGTWEAGTTRFFQTYVPEGGHYVEVGANYGYYTLQAACLVGDGGRVTAFEPGPRMFSLLERTIDINGVSARTTLHQTAVSDRSGTATLYYKGQWHGAAGLYLAPGQLPYAVEEIEVATTTLDRTLPGQRVDFLKVDAEGAEPLIVEGATDLLDANPDLVMLLEVLPGQPTAADRSDGAMLAGLADRGFRFWLIGETGTAHELSVDQLVASVDVARDVCCARRPPVPRPGFPPLIDA